jgi:outer membrane lipoprotein-sorting protein
MSGLATFFLLPARIFFFLSLAFSPAQADPPLTGEMVARKVEERDTGNDSRLEMEMKLYDRRRRETLRRLVLFARREDSRDKVLVRFTYPEDIRDTAFLSLENPSGENDRFLYLPSLGRSRRISAQENQESFVGSDLTYEDISGRRLEDYRYRLLGEETVDGRSCYRLESSARDPDAKYPRSVSWVDKEIFVLRRAQIFDRSLEQAKAYRAERIEKVDGIWTTLSMVMENLKQGTRTVLTASQVAYNRGLPDSLFRRTSLERGVP